MFVAERKKNKEETFWQIFIRSFRTFGLKTEIFNFIESLLGFLTSGMSVVDIFHSLQEETKSRRMKKIIKEIAEKIDDGSPLYRAMEESKILPFHTLALIKYGESSGKLSDNLKLIVMQNEKDSLFKARIRSSLTYAIVIFFLTIVVAIGTAWFVLPTLSSFFGELDVKLPLLTRILLYIGATMKVYGFIIVPVFVIILIIALYFLFSFPKTKIVGHLLLFKLPVVRNLIKYVEIANFCYVMGSMFKSGIPVSETFMAAEHITTYGNYKKFYVYLYNRVIEGNSIGKSFVEYPNIQKLFPSSVYQMISAAEKAGNLSDTFLRIGRMYEIKTEALARDIPIILEPLILMFVGLGVLLLALGIIMPIYNLSYVL